MTEMWFCTHAFLYIYDEVKHKEKKSICRSSTFQNWKPAKHTTKQTQQSSHTTYYIQKQ